MSLIFKRNLKLKSLRYNAIWTLLKADKGIIAPITAKGIPKPSLPTNTANSSRPIMIAPHKTRENTRLAIKATSVASCYLGHFQTHAEQEIFENPHQQAFPQKI